MGRQRHCRYATLAPARYTGAGSTRCTLVQSAPEVWTSDAGCKWLWGGVGEGAGMMIRSLFLALLTAVAVPVAAVAQAVPHWNVTLPAAPGKSTQKVTLTSSTLTIDSVFSQNSIHTVVPLKSITSITKPYLYTNKNWLIDLKLNPKATEVDTLPSVNSIQRNQVDEVSLQFLNEADAAAARAYLMEHLH